jgi:cell division ATPase FtsA
VVDNDIKRMGFDKSLNAGLVLTGGTALLDGLEVVPRKFSTFRSAAGPHGVGGLLDRFGRRILPRPSGCCSTDSTGPARTDHPRTASTAVEQIQESLKEE